MKYFLSIAMAAGWLCLAIAAFAQSNSPPQATPGPAPSAAPATASSPAGGEGKRAACLLAVQGKKGQERQDQMQLCLAQGRLDCLKQAIDQKVVGAQRKDFIKSCMRQP